ncbi:NACHT domain-containing protein [Streptomyces sp. MMBL 11-1]|uniref:NACHT domain-containing protein n=1 Tax=Streptomyces sp. MMBL 11-1 TaxID=3026420 RepID=UPI002360BCC3|nr:NACHT domain-containing protein [Streptomyces sp. MMBL 11-1]
MIQIAHVDRLELAAVTDGPSDGRRRPGTGAWFGRAAGFTGAAFAVMLLLARPDLPLPRGIDPGPVAAGWLVLTGVLVLSTGRWALLRARERRMRRWMSDPYLARAVEDLTEDLSLRYGGDERWELIRNPEPIEVPWREEEGGGSGAPGSGSVAAYFRATPARRLVITGGPGAGKSVLALRLATELLQERQTREGREGPVPVIVPLASWDPREGLYPWIARHVAAEHARACTPVTGAPPVAVALVLLRTRRVLPILDGFDEIPADVRKRAMRRLREGTKGGFPFVLTSRRDEYHEHVPEQNVFSRTEITLCPLADSAVAAYLNPGARPGARWTEVLSRLAEAADGSPEDRLRSVLQVPLMANLAREAFSEEGADPRELLAPGAFADTTAIERRFYDAYLDAIYSPSHEERTGWDPRTARGWAGFLAARMKADTLEYLAWWRLDEHVPRHIRVLALVPAFTLSVALLVRLDLGSWGWPGGIGLSLWQAYAIVCALALLQTALSAADEEHRQPQQIVRPTGARLREAVRGWRGTTLAVLTAVGLAAGWSTAVSTRSGLWLWALTAISWVTVRWCGRRLFLAADDPFLARSPGALLRSDRRSTFALGWLFTAGPPALTVLCGLPLLLLGFWFAARAVNASAGSSADETAVGFFVDVLTESPFIVVLVMLNAASSHRDRLVPLTLVLPLIMLALYAATPAARGAVTTGDWAFTVLATLVCWLLHGTAVSAWGRFQLARLYLAATGSLPLGLMAFLKDAHQRGVLRQSGGAYTFRHIELRDRLAQAVAEETRRDVRRQLPGRQLLAGAFALALIAGTYAVTLQGAAQAVPGSGPVRSLPAACRLLDGGLVAELTGGPDASPSTPASASVLSPWEPDCVVTEQPTFSRVVRVEAGTRLFEPLFDQSAVTLAARQFASWRSSSFRFGLVTEGDPRSLEGLGDEARLHTGRHLVDDIGRQILMAAVVEVRKDNAVLTVRYTEEHADRERVATVAQALARTALRKAGLAPAPADGTTPEPQASAAVGAGGAVPVAGRGGGEERPPAAFPSADGSPSTGGPSERPGRTGRRAEGDGGPDGTATGRSRSPGSGRRGSCRCSSCPNWRPSRGRSAP